jgi:molybdopterin/thiamine biosynthesis adenylyltransferase
MRDVLHIIADAPPAGDRFDRLRLIEWWDQAKLSRAKVLVVGAGALGNEIIKNLALLGVGNLFIADKDHIEHSNLSRSVLYRASDTGKSKAAVAARAAKEIYPDANVGWFGGDVVHDLGLGVFRWADVVIGALDNREARLAINRACWRVRRPWIDGAIEQIQGVARVFVPDAAQANPCYECTMSERDWRVLQSRRSCNLLTREQMEHGGRTPTTPTIASIIAGVQCQEAVKLLHGLDTIAGRGWVFHGLTTDAYQTTYQRKADCYSHETLDEIVALEASADSITLAALMERAAAVISECDELELTREVVEKFVCPRCGGEEAVYESLGRVSSSRAVCPAHGDDVQRGVRTFHKVRRTDSTLLDRTPAQIGLPPMDILIARHAGRSIGLELSGDATKVLGSLVDAGLEWV